MSCSNAGNNNENSTPDDKVFEELWAAHNANMPQFMSFIYDEGGFDAAIPSLIETPEYFSPEYFSPELLSKMCDDVVSADSRVVMALTKAENLPPQAITTLVTLVAGWLNRDVESASDIDMRQGMVYAATTLVSRSDITKEQLEMLCTDKEPSIQFALGVHRMNEGDGGKS